MADIPVAVADRVAAGADAIKIVLTGIIDFSRAAVRGAPQFTARELELLVACAHDAGLPTLAHCSGAAGIDLALAAGVDSIEHGFIMRPDQVDALAANDATWVPTFTPVAFQRDEPDWVGWEPDAVDGLQRILESHAATLRRALVAGVRLLVGSDACSHGVPHGAGLLRECRLMQAAGCDLAQVLTAVTSAPRQAWGLPGGHIAIGQPADLALFDATATAGVDALAHPPRRLDRRSPTGRSPRPAIVALPWYAAPSPRRYATAKPLSNHPPTRHRHHRRAGIRHVSNCSTTTYNTGSDADATLR